MEKNIGRNNGQISPNSIKTIDAQIQEFNESQVGQTYTQRHPKRCCKWLKISNKEKNYKTVREKETY